MILIAKLILNCHCLVYMYIMFCHSLMNLYIVFSTIIHFLWGRVFWILQYICDVMRNTSVLCDVQLFFTFDII